MKRTNKILTLLLCVFVLSSAIMAFADEGSFSGIESKSVDVSDNGDVDVPIDISGNPGITAIKLEVSYDSDVLTLKTNGVTDKNLLIGRVPTEITLNPFNLGWEDSGINAENNFSNGTIATLSFDVDEDFCGTTEVKVVVKEAIRYDEKRKTFVMVTNLQSGIISVTRPKLAIKDGVAIANSLNDEALIIASYDENHMVDCKVYPGVVGDMRIKVADVLDLSGATNVKAFLWGNLETLAPVCDCAEEELNITDIELQRFLNSKIDYGNNLATKY
jgi:hypothetical protein